MTGHTTPSRSRESRRSRSTGERPTFYTQVWSHQLGGHGARSRADLAYVRCYDAGSIRPLPEAVARAFRVDWD